MTIAYVGKAFVMNAVAGTGIAVPMPTAGAAGNKLYVLVGSVGAAAGTITAPSNWAKVLDLITGTNLRSVLYAKTAVSGDIGATHTWTFPASGRNFGYSVAYSGVDVAASDLADVSGSTTADNGPWSTPSLALAAGDWLLTAGVGRESPGTSAVKNWTTSDGADVERFDVDSDSEPSINVTAALWDSGRALTAGSHNRTLNSGATLSQSQVWSVRIPVATDPGIGANPWSHMGIPQR